MDVQEQRTAVQENTTHQRPTCLVVHAGQIPYIEAWNWQRELVRRRSAGMIDDTLLLLQHPHTYTMGRSTGAGHLLVMPEDLVAQGIALVESDRGGDITYHGPGQLVGYPILKLSHYGGDVLRYLRLLEETLIVTLSGYGLRGQRIAGLTGVWIGDRKIAAIGIKLSASGITHHGFALNVTADLRYFDQIIPCGITDKAVTSLDQELGRAPAHHEVEQQVVRAFGEVFGVALQATSSEWIEKIGEI